MQFVDIYKKLTHIMNLSDTKRPTENGIGKAFSELLGSMNSQHQLLIEDLLNQMRQKLNQDEPFQHDNNLFYAFITLIAMHEENIPMVLSSDIAKIYLNDPSAIPFIPCSSCRYPAPMNLGTSSKKPFRYFSRCPLCNKAFDSI